MSIAKRLPDGRIRLRGQTFEGDELEKWIAFYERMFRKYERPTYREAAEALRGLRI